MNADSVIMVVQYIRVIKLSLLQHLATTLPIHCF